MPEEIVCHWSRFILRLIFLEVNLPYESSSGFVGWSVGWFIGRSVCHKFLKKTGKLHTSVILTKHLFKLHLLTASSKVLIQIFNEILVHLQQEKCIFSSCCWFDMVCMWFCELQTDLIFDLPRQLPISGMCFWRFDGLTLNDKTPKYHLLFHGIFSSSSKRKSNKPFGFCISWRPFRILSFLR